MLMIETDTRCGTFHCRRRVPAEPRLKKAHEWLADPRQKALWPRHGTNPVFHCATIGVDEHLEQLFAALGVVRERAVRDSEGSVTVGPADVVQHSRAVQRPEAEMANQHGDICSGVDRWLLGKGLHPTDIEVLPTCQGEARPFEIHFAMTDGDDLFVQSIDRRPMPDDPGRTV